MKIGPYLASATMGLALVVAPFALAPAVAEDPAAQLSIAIDNGRATVEAGDELTYTLTVRNLGANPVSELRLTQSIPPGLEFETADAGGTADAEAVTWSLGLDPNSEVTVQTTMTVGETPGTLLRLASVACASTAVDGPPAVCATDSDQLPAGAPAGTDQADAASPEPPVLVFVAAGGGLVVIAVLLALALVLLRRRRRAEAAGSP